MMAESNEIQGTPLNSPILSALPVASFWRRVFASIIDGFILGIIGQIIGWSLSSILFQVGPYGRLIGLLFIIPYYGVLNSKIGNGQTLGKRLLRIAVRDGYGNPITLKRSLLRIIVLVLPAILNGWTLPILQIGILMWLQAVILFALGAALVYTMLFNWKTRQGIHDLICGTYVVYVRGKPIEVLPKTRRVHLVITSVIILLIIVGVTGLSVFSLGISDSIIGSTKSLFNSLNDDERFFSAQVLTTQTNSISPAQGQPFRTLNISVWYRGLPSESERKEVTQSIAKKALANVNGIEQYDGMSITITTAYDIAIATGHVAYQDRDYISGWQQRVK